MKRRTINFDTLSRKFENELKGCVICGANRVGFSRYCVSCKTMYYRTSNPKAKGVLLRRMYLELLEPAERIINLGIEQEHRGIATALRHFDNWMSGKSFVLCGDVFQSQKSKGVTPKDLLVEILATYLFYKLNRKLWDEIPSIRFQLGISIIRYKKASPRFITSSEKRSFGHYIFDVFNPLLENLYKHLRQELEEAKERKEAFQEPLEIT